MAFGTVDKMLLLILILICFLYAGQCLNQGECSPAQEGRPYTMECSIHLNSGVGFFIWSRRFESDNKQLAMCHGFDLNCDDHDSDHYLTTNTVGVNNTILTSQLTINNVSPKDRNQTFECKIWNTKLDKHSIVKSCVLRTYRLPENPRCQAQRLGSNAIEVSCQISRFFPEVVCDMSQLYGDVLEPMSGNVSYQNKQTIYESGDQYHSIVCSSVVKIEFPGTYTILVNMYPKIQGQIYRQSRVEVFTNEVKFSPMVSIKVEQTPELSDCENSEDMTTFICLVESFIRPRFRWYLGDTLLSTDPNITAQEWNQTTFSNFFYESTYNLSINSSHHGYNLTCEAFYNNSDSEESYESLNGFIKIRALARLPPPVFKDNKGTQLEDVYVLHPDTGLDLSCEVEGKQQGDILISHLSLDCRDSVDERDNLISLKSSGTSLEFNIDLSEIGNSRNISCSCFAEYVNSCQNVSFTSLLLIQNYETETENILAEKQTGKEPTRPWLWLLLGGTLMGMGLAVLAFIVLLLFVRVQKRKLSVS